jgi:hypothetical protein
VQQLVAEGHLDLGRRERRNPALRQQDLRPQPAERLRRLHLGGEAKARLAVQTEALGEPREEAEEERLAHRSGAPDQPPAAPEAPAEQGELQAHAGQPEDQKSEPPGGAGALKGRRQRVVAYIQRAATGGRPYRVRVDR